MLTLDPNRCSCSTHASSPATTEQFAPIPCSTRMEAVCEAVGWLKPLWEPVSSAASNLCMDQAPLCAGLRGPAFPLHLAPHLFCSVESERESRLLVASMVSPRRWADQSASSRRAIGLPACPFELHIVDARRRMFRSASAVESTATLGDELEATEEAPGPAFGATVTTSPPISFTRSLILFALSRHIFHRASASFLPSATPTAGGGSPLASKSLHRCAASR